MSDTPPWCEQCGLFGSSCCRENEILRAKLENEIAIAANLRKVIEEDAKRIRELHALWRTTMSAMAYR